MPVIILTMLLWTYLLLLEQGPRIQLQQFWQTYLALDLCYERKVRKMLCSVHILYFWLMARVGDNILGVRCPIELVTRKKLEKRSGKEWALFVAGLN